MVLERACRAMHFEWDFALQGCGSALTLYAIADLMLKLHDILAASIVDKIT